MLNISVLLQTQAYQDTNSAEKPQHQVLISYRDYHMNDTAVSMQAMSYKNCIIYYCRSIVGMTVVPSSLAPVKSTMINLSGAGLARLSCKKGR